MNTIERAGYTASEEQIEQLARDVAIGKRADSTYLRVLVAAVQSALKGKRQRALTALQAAHERFYAAVLRGVGADDISPKERTRRATFARTATSTLRSFAKTGGDIRTLDVATVTKAGLRALVSPEIPAGTRAERSAARATSALLRALKRMQPAEARQMLDSTVRTLQARRESLTVTGRAARVVSERRTTTAAARASH